PCVLSQGQRCHLPAEAGHSDSGCVSSRDGPRRSGLLHPAVVRSTLKRGPRLYSPKGTTASPLLAREEPCFYGFKMSAATSTTGVFPLFSSQCVVSFPTDSSSPLEWSFVAPPSRCSVRVPCRMYATAGRSLCEWMPMTPLGSRLSIRSRSCRPCIPSISPPRSRVTVFSTASPLLSFGGDC